MSQKVEESAKTPTPVEEATKDPALIPRAGRFFQHDDRGSSGTPNKGRGGGRNNRSHGSPGFGPKGFGPKGFGPPNGPRGAPSGNKWAHDKFKEISTPVKNNNEQGRQQRKNGNNYNNNNDDEVIQTQPTQPWSMVLTSMQSMQ